MIEQAALEHKEIVPILAAQHTKIDLPIITTTTTTTTHDETESANTSDLPDTHYTSHTNESNNNTDSNTNIDTNNIVDPINTNTPTTTTTTTTTITIIATTKQHEEVPFPILESILSKLADLLPVNKVAKKRKIIDNDDIDSGEEDEE
jgi:type I site-specific restriction endonuclease